MKFLFNKSFSKNRQVRQVPLYHVSICVFSSFQKIDTLNRSIVILVPLSPHGEFLATAALSNRSGHHISPRAPRNLQRACHTRPSCRTAGPSDPESSC